MTLVKSYLTKNPCYQANINRADSRYTTFQARGPLALMLHSVGCAQPSAAVFIKGWNNPSYDRACVHGIIDANDGTAYQCLPWNFRGWHCGGSGNNTHIGIEMCESAYIKYTSGTKFQVLNRAKAQADCRRAYETAVQLFAIICKEYGLNPITKICSHKEGHSQGIASGHGDPEHYWQGLGMGYTMDGFRAAVKAELDRINTPEPEPAPEPEPTPAQPTPPKEEEIDMTREEVKELISDTVKEMMEESLGKYITEAEDIPHASVRAQMRELLDKGFINGGTSYEENPNDIYLPYNVVRALVVAKAYCDGKFKAAKITSEV